MEPSSGHKFVLPQDSLDGVMVADAIKFEVIEGLQAVYADGIKLVSNEGQDINYVHVDHLGAPMKMADKHHTIVWDASHLLFRKKATFIGPPFTQTKQHKPKTRPHRV